MFENHRRSLILQHCERSELCLHLGQKFIKNAKIGQFFEKLKLAVKQCYQMNEAFLGANQLSYSWFESSYEKKQCHQFAHFVCITCFAEYIKWSCMAFSFTSHLLKQFFFFIFSHSVNHCKLSN